MRRKSKFYGSCITCPALVYNRRHERDGYTVYAGNWLTHVLVMLCPFDSVYDMDTMQEGSRVMFVSRSFEGDVQSPAVRALWPSCENVIRRQWSGWSGVTKKHLYGESCVAPEGVSYLIVFSGPHRLKERGNYCCSNSRTRRLKVVKLPYGNQHVVRAR